MKGVEATMQGRLCRFIRDDRASVTVEFVLWVPIIAALLVMAVDATTLYVTHSEMWTVARDTARRMVIGTITSTDDAEAHALNALTLRDFPYAVRADYDPNGTASVLIAFEVLDMSIIGYGSPLTILGGTVKARVIMRPDPRIPFGTGT